ncbi:MAG: hypothetical protein CMH55_08125 [Myxococcales bacterium]|nr:hypothetical protein [Myxococcales bacterium]
MTERDEAQRLAQLFEGRPVALVTFLSGQLSVLKSQAQMQLGLCGLGNIRWVTQDLSDDLSQTAQQVLQRRNQQQRQLVVSAVFVALGLTAYLGSVMLAALHVDNL